MSEELKNNTPEAAVNEAKKEKKPRKNIFTSKKFKHGSLSVLFTVIFVVAVVLVNVILNLVLDRFDVEVDLTEGGIYTIGEEMETFIKESDSKVNIYFATDEETLESAGSVYKQTLEFAKKTAEMNSGYTLQHVDLLTNPTFAEKYVDVTAGSMIIECEETGRYRVFDIANDFLRYTMSDGESYSYSEATMMSYYGYTPVAETSIAEQELLSGLMSITKVNPVKIGFLTGFGEKENEGLVTLLEKNTYVVEKFDIDMAESVPEEYDILVMNAPTMDYSADAVNKLDTWLSNGGLYGKNLIYFAAIENAAATPVLDQFLAEWGLKVDMSYVCQMDSNYFYPVMGYAYPYYQRAEIVEDTEYYSSMQLNKDTSFRVNGTRPVIMLWEEKSNFVNRAILQTYGEDCLLQPFDADESFNPEAVERSRYSLVVEASKVRYDGTTPYYSRVIAAGSDNIFTRDFLNATNYNNAEVAVSIFNTISGNADESIKITPKSFTATTYEIDAGQQGAIAVTFVVIIPVIIIITGIVVWIRRKRL